MALRKPIMYELGKDTDRWIGHDPRMAGKWSMVLGCLARHWGLNESTIMFSGEISLIMEKEDLNGS